VIPADWFILNKIKFNKIIALNKVLNTVEKVYSGWLLSNLILLL